MEQRRLRLGDILDDYCPRERRVTNHAVVAMIEEDVKQTRCTTCDAEHAYKGGKAPRRRRKEEPATLYNEVLAGMPESEAPILAAREPDLEAAEVEPAFVENIPAELAAADESAPESGEPEAGRVPEIEGPVHRPLIRATLPRPEGQKDTRPIPEFTIRQPGGRPAGNFRGGDPRMKQRGGHGANGNRTHGSGRGQGFGGPRPSGHGRGGAQGRGGPGVGFRSGQQPRHGGKKRSR